MVLRYGLKRFVGAYEAYTSTRMFIRHSTSKPCAHGESHFNNLMRVTGPVLSSKRAALQFSINGLMHISNRTVKEQQKVESAEEMLRDIEYPQKPAATPSK